jgi:hypothetical protein
VIDVPVTKPTEPNLNSFLGFIETDGYVSMEAEHFSRAVAPPGYEWKIIPDFGRTLSGVTMFPVTKQVPASSTCLEYEMYLSKGGEVNVDAYFAPTQKFQPGSGFRYAISFDDEKPQIVNFHDGYTQAEWERSVKDSVRILTSKHVLSKPGEHTLKFWVIDPGLVLEKIVVNGGGVRPSYLGPPESASEMLFHKQ